MILRYYKIKISESGSRVLILHSDKRVQLSDKDTVHLVYRKEPCEYSWVNSLRFAL